MKNRGSFLVIPTAPARGGVIKIHFHGSDSITRPDAARTHSCHRFKQDERCTSPDPYAALQYITSRTKSKCRHQKSPS